MKNTLGVGGSGREIFASATWPLQFAKASSSTLSQQENNNSADAQRGRVNIFGSICIVASKPARRRTFDEVLSLAVALWRVLQHQRMFIPLAPAAQNLAVKPRRRRARRSHGRHRVRQRTSRAAVLFLPAVASFRPLDAAVAIHKFYFEERTEGRLAVTAHRADRTIEIALQADFSKGGNSDDLSS